MVSDGFYDEVIPGKVILIAAALGWVIRILWGSVHLYRQGMSLLHSRLRPVSAARPSSGLRWFLPAASSAIGAAAALALALLPSGCGLLPRQSALTVPVSSWPGYEYFYLASQLGLDQKYGLHIDPVQFADPQEIVHAYLRGDLQLAQLTTVEVIDLCSRVPDRCPVVVLVLDESRGGDQLMVRPGLTSVAQLRGKRIGVSPSTLGPYLLSRALNQAGMELRDVTIRSITLDAMPDALAQGAIDAAAIFPPFSAMAAHRADARSVFDSRQIPGEIFDVLVVEPGFLDQHRSGLVALVRAWQAAHRLASVEPEQATALIARRQQISADDVRQAQAGIVYFSLAEQRSMLEPTGLIARNLESVQKVQSRLGLIAEGAPLPRVSPDVVMEALR